MNTDKLITYGIGIKTATYFKLLYPVYSGDTKYYIMHMAIFGMN